MKEKGESFWEKIICCINFRCCAPHREPVGKLCKLIIILFEKWSFFVKQFRDNDNRFFEEFIYIYIHLFKKKSSVFFSIIYLLHWEIAEESSQLNGFCIGESGICNNIYLFVLLGRGHSGWIFVCFFCQFCYLDLLFLLLLYIYTCICVYVYTYLYIIFQTVYVSLYLKWSLVVDDNFPWK